MIKAYNFLKNELSLLDVLKDYMDFEKIGSYWKSSCLFCKKPEKSFAISPRNIFYCFSCHYSGDVVTFTAKMQDCSPKDAVDKLLEKYNLIVPEVLPDYPKYIDPTWVSKAKEQNSDANKEISQAD